MYLKYGEVSVIDFGGGMGSTYFQNRDKIIDCLDIIQWNVVQQKHFVDFGKRYMEDKKIEISLLYRGNREM